MRLQPRVGPAKSRGEPSAAATKAAARGHDLEQDPERDPPLVPKRVERLDGRRRQRARQPDHGSKAPAQVGQDGAQGVKAGWRRSRASVRCPRSWKRTTRPARSRRRSGAQLEQLHDELIDFSNNASLQPLPPEWFRSKDMDEMALAESVEDDEPELGKDVA